MAYDIYFNTKKKKTRHDLSFKYKNVCMYVSMFNKLISLLHIYIGKIHNWRNYMQVFNYAASDSDSGSDTKLSQSFCCVVDIWLQMT